MFVPWAKGEKYLSFPSFHSISEFFFHSYRHSGAPEWTLIRKVFDWRAAFDPIKCDISGYFSARLFRFIKEHSRVVMWYKTNTTENEWRGFQYEENGVIHSNGISVCNSYISSPPPIIPQDILIYPPLICWQMRRASLITMINHQKISGMNY